jgi:hypothetical protein
LFTKALVLISLACTSAMMYAQARPTASRSTSLQVGGGFVGANSDYVPNHIYGGAAYFDFDFMHNLGLEGEFHYVKDTKGTDVYEKTYEIGGRYHRTYGRFMPYGKGMYGRGVFNFPNFPGYGHANLAYNLFAIGGGLDYRITRHVNARADYEYQHWMSFPPNGLTPTLLTFGAAWHF